jgi:lipopolysaccharide/colanic/teichoic acid biosynthesis glycosyltransferase
MGFFSKLETAAPPVDSEIQRASCEEEMLDGGVAALSEREFRRVLCQERKRSERSRKNFVLMLVREKRRLPGGNASVLPRITRVLGRTIRDTDVLGWFTLNVQVGTIFCELGTGELSATVRCIEAKIFTALSAALSPDELDTVELDFHSYPYSWNKGDDNPALSPVLYPDLLSASEQKRGALFVKRLIDVLGSALALLVLAPVFALLALIIKLTSKGPVFFRQQRLGQFQQPFVFLKFRSMRVSTSHDIHREYVRNYIAGRAESAKTDQRRVVYKITDDPRVTPIGRFMRRTSLDELPQFLNVLKGEMSLVGPRPPIPYEIEAYDIWHRRRLLEAKPGITGLWQVYGRSRTTFDEMVRLDLQYSRTFSLSSDIKILFETPRAVISGNGAY